MRSFSSSSGIQRGASLIEVLISLVLVAVTMLGLLGLQLRTLGLQKDSFDRRNAAILVSAFGDRLAGNFSGLVSGQYANLTMDEATTPPALPSSCASVNACTVAEIAARDWTSFQIEVRNRLPAGVAFVRSGADPSSLQVTLGWLDPQRVPDPAAPPDVDAPCAAFLADPRFRCYRANVFP
jgi:type IV pilus assembly protein PilV